MNKEINELKVQIDEARKSFSKKMEAYDLIRFKKARIEVMKDLK